MFPDVSVSEPHPIEEDLTVRMQSFKLSACPSLPSRSQCQTLLTLDDLLRLDGTSEPACVLVFPGLILPSEGPFGGDARGGGARRGALRTSPMIVLFSFLLE